MILVHLENQRKGAYPNTYNRRYYNNWNKETDISDHYNKASSEEGIALDINFFEGVQLGYD